MECPECKCNLAGNESDKCPECGTLLAVINPMPLRVPTRLLYTGAAFIAVYCIAQTVWFWRDLDIFNTLVMAGGYADPSNLETSVRILMVSRYVSNVSLGIGLTCMAFALFSVFRKVLARL